MCEKEEYATLDEILKLKIDFNSHEDLGCYNSENIPFKPEKIQAGFVLGANNSRCLFHETNLLDWKGKTVKQIFQEYGIKKLEDLIGYMKRHNLYYLELSYAPYFVDSLPSTDDSRFFTNLDLKGLIELHIKMLKEKKKALIEEVQLSTKDILLK